jgi:S-disulfanyl-L-cysteine oxidoreductase SoxD
MSALVVAAIINMESVSVGAQDASSTSVRDGVYTEAQADRGKALFEERCTDCHTPKMWGSDWTGRSVADIFDFISNYMPEPNPGSLSPQQVRDVLAHIFKSNDLPAGAMELPETIAALKQIRLEPAVAR